MKAEASAVTPSTGFDCAVCGARLDDLHVEVGPTGTLCSFCGSPQRRAGQPALKLVPHNGRPSADALDALKTARIERGETLEQAARFTRIRTSYLRALEDGDTSSLETYPGRRYVRYFLREYAEHLRLEPGPLLRRFDETRPAFEPVPSVPIWQRLPHPRRWAIGALILLIVLLVGNALLDRGAGERPIARPAVHPPASVGLPPQQAQAHVTPPASPEGVRAVIQTTGRSWVLAVVDGSAAIEETVPAGKTIRLRASETFDLRLGNAGEVRLTVNGRPIATGGSGDVVDLSFVWRDDHLVRTR